MIYNSEIMEATAILNTASKMCAAARTAPKTRGIDNILTLVLTGEDKDKLADKMDEVAKREFGDKKTHFYRDADNMRKAGAVVLIGVKKVYAGLPYCSFCGFPSCAACEQAGGRCAFNGIDLGIALCSAMAIAADDRIDNRVMFSIGKAAEEMEYGQPGVIWNGIPLSVSGKNIFFDRK